MTIKDYLLSCIWYRDLRPEKDIATAMTILAYNMYMKGMM